MVADAWRGTKLSRGEVIRNEVRTRDLDHCPRRRELTVESGPWSTCTATEIHHAPCVCLAKQGGKTRHRRPIRPRAHDDRVEVPRHGIARPRRPPRLISEFGKREAWYHRSDDPMFLRCVLFGFIWPSGACEPGRHARHRQWRGCRAPELTAALGFWPRTSRNTNSASTSQGRRKCAVCTAGPSRESGSACCRLRGRSTHVAFSRHPRDFVRERVPNWSAGFFHHRLSP